MPRRARKSKHLTDGVEEEQETATAAVTVNGVVDRLRSPSSSDREELVTSQESSNIPNCLAKSQLDLTSSFKTKNANDHDQVGHTGQQLKDSDKADCELDNDGEHSPNSIRCETRDAESESDSSNNLHQSADLVEPSSPPPLVCGANSGENSAGDCKNELDEQCQQKQRDDINRCHAESNNVDEEPTNLDARMRARESPLAVGNNVHDDCRPIDSLNVAIEEPEESHSQLEIFAETCRRQKEEIERLSDENRVLRENANSAATASEMTVLAEETADIYEVQMAALEKTITQLQREVEAQRDKLADQEDAASLTIAQLKRELGGRLDKATRQLELILKEKESAVVKYAQSEATVLSLKKNVEENDRKFKELARERDILLNKVRLLTADKSRLSHALDTKLSEVASAQRECEKLREEISSKDIKIKWAQNRLKTETDTHKETISKLERTEHKLRETREEAEQVRRDCQEMIRTYQESEEIKSNSLDIQLRVKESELKLERQEKSTKEEVQQIMKQELESVKSKLKICIDENNGLTIKLQTLERERLDYESNLGRMKEQSNSGFQEIVDLQARLAEMDNLMVQINREKEKVIAAQTEIERLRQTNAELQIDMEACRRKEGELLEFTERLTGKNVSLQSEFSCLEAKCQALQRELPIIRKRCDEFELQNTNLALELTEEQEQHKKETHLLARKLAEKTKAIETLNVKLEEQVNDNRVLRRKNASTIRELSREIQSLRRRIDVHEANSRGNLDSQSLGSRASSTTSLDALGQRDAPANGSLVQQTTKLSCPIREGHDRSEDSQPVQPTQEMLVERIVKLQRAHARKNEKIEFLEEHVNQLVQELKKKSRLIQNYVIREDSGTLSTVSMDQHKLDVSRRGGIMASLYTSHQADNGLTLDLSLEISRKLQAVLEDTLLKNITLKENIKTLGDEIARLSLERRQL